MAKDSPRVDCLSAWRLSYGKVGSVEFASFLSDHKKYRAQYHRCVILEVPQKKHCMCNLMDWWAWFTLSLCLTILELKGDLSFDYGGMQNGTS